MKKVLAISGTAVVVATLLASLDATHGEGKWLPSFLLYLLGIAILVGWAYVHEVGGIRGIRSRLARRRLRRSLELLAISTGAECSEWSAAGGAVYLGYGFRDGSGIAIPIAPDGGYNPHCTRPNETDSAITERFNVLADAVCQACRTPGHH